MHDAFQAGRRRSVQHCRGMSDGVAAVWSDQMNRYARLGRQNIGCVVSIIFLVYVRESGKFYSLDVYVC